MNHLSPCSVALAGALLLAACTPDSAPPPESALAVSAPASDEVAPSTSRPALFLRGYYESRDGGLFTACGETSRRTLASIDPATAAALAEENAKQDRPRFLMAEGNLRGRDAVEIGRFNLISGDAWNCVSRLGEIILGARCTEELWSLEVTPAAATFVAGPSAVPEVHAYAGLADGVDGLSVRLGDKDAAFSVRLRGETCSEAMTGTLFAWSVVVDANGQSFKGCAWRGLASP
ncbi:MAG: hypothetical protein WAU20_05275 [Dokdonella sp.]